MKILLERKNPAMKARVQTKKQLPTSSENVDIDSRFSMVSQAQAAKIGVVRHLSGVYLPLVRLDCVGGGGF